jgi:hypothetical protein
MTSIFDRSGIPFGANTTMDPLKLALESDNQRAAGNDRGALIAIRPTRHDADERSSDSPLVPLRPVAGLAQAAERPLGGQRYTK